MDRPDDALIPAGTAWLDDRAAQRVCAAVAAGDHRVFFVGGCVRDAILGRGGSDVDLATDARPERVIELAEVAGLKCVPTGIDHGTVTVVAEGRGFEVTTFRRDVKTDGRRAVVAFTDDIAEDARRRDFTMNALYATPTGRVVDPLGGLPDLLARRVRFIEDADARIREDYLRTLRYFRFVAWYGDPQIGFDPDALDAIARNLSGLETLSAERIGTEVMKLLSAPDPVAAVAGMRATGGLAVLLPGADDRFLGPVVHLESGTGDADPVLRLAALGGEGVADRLRLSRADVRTLEAMTESAGSAQGIAEIAYRHGPRIATAAAILRAAMAGTEMPAGTARAVETGAQAVFPVRAADLMPALSGPALGETLRRIEQRWIESGFTLGRDDLLPDD
ncbi:CCA tRNA nucleotidyltransferase [Sulfitobacter sp. D35]|uniref:CCA tRNA nucleotidyltransferase n=1 Tax=Sulfitobacter sp. D35 TaxID=3083252 RepID=UPI00296FDB35|nr:CCA tRNA nucleotidyltransferase [Sulfitobacter sp. D35]MDW4498047.1 CCA tRNA nucleotidyltransferase [Sulfitobacter sp. D35]